MVWGVLALTYGAWWTPDTLTYLAGAEALLDGGLSTGLHFRPLREPYPSLTGWPPGYPALLAPLLGLGLAPTTATMVVSGTCFIATHVLLAKVLQLLTNTKEAGFLALFLLGFGPMLEIGLRGWSEGPWTVVLLLLVWALTGESTRTRAGAAGALSSCLFLIRHASLVMLPLTVAMVAWRSRSWHRTGESALVQLLVAAPWIGFSLWTTGRVGFSYPRTDTALSDVLWAVGEGLLGSFSGAGMAVFSDWPVPVVFVAVAALAVVVTGLQRTREPSGPGQSGAVPAFIVVCGLAHVGAYVAVRVGHYLDDPDDRILFPLTFTVLFSVLVFMGRRLRPRSAPRFTALALLWCGTVVTHHAVHPDPPFDWVHLERYDRRMAWIEAHTTREDLVLGPSSMVTHYRTGRPTLGTIWPPYGEPFLDDELEDLVERWPGRVVFLLGHKERARAADAGLWTIADHPDARPLAPSGEGFTAWWVPTSGDDGTRHRDGG